MNVIVGELANAQISQTMQTHMNPIPSLMPPSSIGAHGAYMHIVDDMTGRHSQSAQNYGMQSCITPSKLGQLQHMQLRLNNPLIDGDLLSGVFKDSTAATA